MRGTSKRAAAYISQGLLSLIRRKGNRYSGYETVVAFAVPDGNYLVVLSCPFCGGEHRHSDGYGTRVPPCYPSSGAEYALTPPVGLTDRDFPALPLEGGW